MSSSNADDDDDDEEEDVMLMEIKMISTTLCDNPKPSGDVPITFPPFWWPSPHFPSFLT
jgi:hypothetical protein